MSKLTVIGNVPNTTLVWEKLEYEVWLDHHQTGHAIDYLLVDREWGKRKVLANLDMGQLVALRTSIDALVEVEAAQEVAQAEK